MKYLYYTLYRHLLRGKSDNTIAWNAMLVISLLEYINIYTISHFFKISLSQFNIEKQVILAVFIPFIILIFINYFILTKNVKKLVDKYKDESKKEKVKGNIYL